jgi:hypothetical protein
VLTKVAVPVAGDVACTPSPVVLLQLAKVVQVGLPFIQHQIMVLVEVVVFLLLVVTEHQLLLETVAPAFPHLLVVLQ